MTVFDVADWFLSRERMTHKNLQKLCYYALAWSYAICPEPICDAVFEAWAHGPVNRDLYDKYKSYKFSYIPQQETPSGFSADENRFLRRIWATYGPYDADSLEILSHSELPWKNARRGLDGLEHSTKPISIDDMQYYYRSIYIGGDA